MTGQTPLERQLRRHVEALCAFDPPRSWGSAGLDEAGSWVHDALKDATGSAEIQSFDASMNGRSHVVWNVVSRVGRGVAPLRVIGAHYDAVAGTPGADDNASAVAVLIELGRLLAAAQPDERRPPVELVAYTLEEPPAFGSEAMGSAVHAGRLRRSKAAVEGMISLEMVGYFDRGPATQRLPPGVSEILPEPPSSGDFYALTGKAYARAWVERVEAGLHAHLHTPLLTLVVPDAYGRIDLSDHVSYQECGIPAAMLGDTSHYRNPHYHGPTDLPHTLDYGRMADLTTSLAHWLIDSPVRRKVQG